MSFNSPLSDTTQQITLEMVKTKAVRGVAVLTGRTFFLSLISLAATGFLTVFLDPKDFGIFWMVSAVVNFLAYFSDIGLAAALIQKKEEVDQSDLSTTFFVQQILVIFLLILLFVLSPIIGAYYNLSSEGQILLYSLGLSLFLSSLKTIPSVLLERELEFGKLVIPQVLENLAYNLVAVYFAWRGAGIWAFTFAVVVRGIVGLIAMYIIRPWFPSFSFSKKSLVRLLRFGVPYQANTLLATVKDDGMTAFLGGVLGASGLGLLGWAQKWAYMPLRLFLDHVLKVTFPAFSRMQDNKVELKNALSRSIFFVCFLVFPSVIGLLVLAPPLVEIIPRYDKWRPALLPLVLISVNTLFAAGTTQLTNLLNAIGKIKTTFKLMVMWTVLTWVFVPYMAIKYGVVGAAAGYSLVGISSIVAIVIVHKIVKFSFIRSIIVPLVGSILMGFVMLLVRNILQTNLVSIWIIFTIGLVSYMLIMYFFVGRGMIDDIKKGIKAVFKR